MSALTSDGAPEGYDALLLARRRREHQGAVLHVLQLGPLGELRVRELEVQLGHDVHQKLVQPKSACSRSSCCSWGSNIASGSTSDPTIRAEPSLGARLRRGKAAKMPALYFLKPIDSIIL